MLHISDHRGRDLSFHQSPAWRSCHPDHITAAQNSWVPTESLRTVRRKPCSNYLSSDSETAPLLQQLGVPDTQGLSSLPGLCSPFLRPQRAGSAWAFSMQSLLHLGAQCLALLIRVTIYSPVFLSQFGTSQWLCSNCCFLAGIQISTERGKEVTCLL